MQFDAVQREAGKVELGARPHASQVGGDVAAIVLEQQTVPRLHFVVVQVQAGIMRKMRRADELTLGRVGPAVQRAHDVAAGAARLGVMERTATLEHHRLAMPADVGDQFHTFRCAHQGAAFVLLRQGVIVAHFRNAGGMPQIAGPALKDQRHFALEQRLVKVA